jgi:mono/diheme cytochrome c family protein
MPSNVNAWIAACILAAGAAATARSEDLSSYSGPQLFQKLCASCHGPGGRGDGAVAPLFKLSPPDLTRIAARHSGVFDRDKIRQFIDGTGTHAAHGTREMPVWGVELQAAAQGPDGARNQTGAILDSLVEFLRSIQRN